MKKVLAFTLVAVFVMGMAATTFARPRVYQAKETKDLNVFNPTLQGPVEVKKLELDESNPIFLPWVIIGDPVKIHYTYPAHLKVDADHNDR